MSPLARGFKSAPLVYSLIFFRFDLIVEYLVS